MIWIPALTRPNVKLLVPNLESSKKNAARATSTVAHQTHDQAQRKKYQGAPHKQDDPR